MRWSERITDRTAGVDWFRFTLPAAARSRAIETLENLFGPGEEGKGRYFLGQGVRFAHNAGVYHDDSRVHCVVDVPGGALGKLEEEERYRLLCDILRLGGRATRIDVREDWHGALAGLLGDLTAACERGELCGAKLWDPKQPRKGSSYRGEGLCLGSRGKDGSGRYGRPYDKGLESGLAPRGEWVRYEVEFADDCAQDVAAGIGAAFLDGGCEAARAAARAYLFGAFEFREATGQRRSRRPLCEWWIDLTAVPVARAVTRERVSATLAGYIAWLECAVFPVLEEVTERTGCSLDELKHALVGEYRHGPRGAEGKARVQTLIREIADGSIPVRGDPLVCGGV